MKVRILGCSGGIGGRHLRTTAILVDEDILIDCGTGVADLSMAELARIDHVFLTHSHLDHIACLPLMIDTVGDIRSRPLMVHALPETIDTLRKHIFNWAIWPDFSQIATDGFPWLAFEPLGVGQGVSLDMPTTRRITALPASHTVPAVAYQLDGTAASLVFSGDTGPCPAFWTAVNAIPNLKTLLIETAFSDHQRKTAEQSLHLCPSLLRDELARLQSRPDIYITHLKPGQIERTLQEIDTDGGEFAPLALQNNQIFEL